jgi:protein tyrosine phosphatase (PTP) superfamily phosphohydrolase (DUF442 family)
MRSLLVALVGLLAAGLAVPCGTASGQPPAADKKPEPAKVGRVTPLHVHNGVWLAGQPSPDELKLFKEKGVKTVINLREKGETDWDEAAVVKELGMTYHLVPFKAPETLTAAVFDQARRVLNDRQNQPILLHCSTSNRVGAIWLAHRVLDHGLSYESALAEAKQIGLRTPEYAEKARDYIRKHKK